MSNLNINLLWLFGAVIISAVVYPLLINLLYRFQFREKVREFGPKTHLKKLGTPTMGGIGFVFVTLALSVFVLLKAPEYSWTILVFLVASAFGFIEDWFKAYSKSKLRKDIRIEVYEVFSKSEGSWKLYNYLLIPWNLFREFTRIIGSNASNRGVRLKSHYKFLMHVALGAFVGFYAYLVLGFNSISVPFFGDLSLGIVYPFFIMFFFVFTLNAVAITDGLDGLLTGISLQIILVYWVIAGIVLILPISNILAILFGTLLVYLYFNTFPARVFMGDVGSYGLGAILFVIPLVLRLEFLILITHALCLFDGGISGLLQQFSMKFRKKRVFKMAPIHHHFEVLGWPESKVTIRFWLVQAILSLLGLLVYFYI